MYYKKFLYSLLITFLFIFIIKYFNNTYLNFKNKNIIINNKIINKNINNKKIIYIKKKTKLDIINKLNKIIKNNNIFFTKKNFFLINIIINIIYYINYIYKDWIITIVVISIIIKLFLYLINKIKNIYSINKKKLNTNNKNIINIKKIY